MQSAMEHPRDDSTATSLSDAWQHFRAILKARTFSAGWNELKLAVDATPVWALVAIVLVGLSMVTNAWVVPTLIIGVGAVTATFLTVKFAVREALREHDAEQRPR